MVRASWFQTEDDPFSLKCWPFASALTLQAN
jgi:hypothetical protein